METVRIEHSFKASPRIGQILVTHEVQRARPLMAALFSLLTLIHAEPHPSGRGTRFIVACDKDCKAFDELAEGQEIPEYRVEFTHDGHFENPDLEARRVESGRFAFAFVRRIIVRVPPARVGLGPHTARLH